MGKSIQYEILGPAYRAFAYAVVLLFALPVTLAFAAESFADVSKLVNETRDQVFRAIRSSEQSFSRDGSVMKLIFEEPFPSENSHGVYNGTTDITAKSQFTKRLRALLGKMEPAVSNDICELDRSVPERQ